MKTLQLEKIIQAPAEKVYKSMLGLGSKTSYEQWTAAFNPTSTYEGTWEKGAKMYFVGTDSKGKKGGMVSEIADLIPNELVSICHLGMLDGDQEITSGPMVEEWAGCMEKYFFAEKDGQTTVTVHCDMADDYADSFLVTWEKALEELKKSVEN